MSTYTFIPYEFPHTADGRYFVAQETHQIIVSRREQLGLSQQQVADRAKILLRQYQKIEAGDIELHRCSTRVSLSVCAALLLDPYEIVDIPDIDQPDPKTIKPQRVFEMRITDEELRKHKAGRKPIRPNLMKVYLNHPNYNVIIPIAVLEELDRPEYIQLATYPGNSSLLIRPVSREDEEAMDVPTDVYNCGALAIPGHSVSELLCESFGWENDLRLADAFLVHDSDGNAGILIDTKNASITEPIMGDLVIPNCYDDPDDEDFEDEEDENEEYD